MTSPTVIQSLRVCGPVEQGADRGLAQKLILGTALVSFQETQAEVYPEVVYGEGERSGGNMEGRIGVICSQK